MKKILALPLAHESNSWGRTDDNFGLYSEIDIIRFFVNFLFTIFKNVTSVDRVHQGVHGHGAEGGAAVPLRL